MMRNAVIRSLEVIGEASKKIPGDIKKEYSIVPWKSISGMRDKLIHEYFGIDTSILWETIKKRIPELADNLKKIYQEIFPVE